MTIRESLEQVKERIALVQTGEGVNQKVSILAVTKTHPASVVRKALAVGLKQVGENRVQEAESKFSEIEGLEFVRHLIGPLQENKVNKAAKIFDWVQSIEKFKVVEKLNRKRREMKRPMDVLIEINLSGESTKFGIRPEEAEELTGQIAELDFIRLRGYMTIGPLTSDKVRIRRAFAQLFSIREKMKGIYSDLDLDVLSMGMSGDYELAVAEGATLLRLGSVLFGKRDYR